MIANANRYSFTPNTSTPAGQILEYLLRNGTAGVKDLEDELQVTATAVRQQLANLSSEGLIAATKERRGVGRPRNIYYLTEKANGLFACQCDELALSLIGELLDTEGSDKLRFLLNRVSNKLAKEYSNHLKGEAIGDRVRELSVLLDRRGIRAGFEEGPGKDVITLREYNCPYHELASVHRDVCEMERDAFAKALGAQVELGDCIQDGYHSCQFVVSRTPLLKTDGRLAGLPTN